MFARKPAPVQVTYLAYCSTTGIDAMDCRLSDPYLDPPEIDESVYVEKTVRLPRTYWCYQVPLDVPDVSPLPAASAGNITFGCLNNYCKVTKPTWRAWYQILRQVPQSKLVVHADRGKHREVARQRMAEAGVDPNRLEFADFLPPLEYFRFYHTLDIVLDPFPYAGGTTTCDAMWMGVPVVTLAGQTAVSRGGFSLLSDVGLPELVARDVNQYVRIAADLASDVNRLAELRSTLRQKMLASPILDAPQFARDVEAALRWMWRQWCGGAKAPSLTLPRSTGGGE
jgi:predicted O-linked N-acetylglucosamine transferase (SPINDLY family)